MHSSNAFFRTGSQDLNPGVLPGWQGTQYAQSLLVHSLFSSWMQELEVGIVPSAPRRTQESSLLYQMPPWDKEWPPPAPVSTMQNLSHSKGHLAKPLILRTHLFPRGLCPWAYQFGKPELGSSRPALAWPSQGELSVTLPFI